MMECKTALRPIKSRCVMEWKAGLERRVNRFGMWFSVEKSSRISRNTISCNYFDTVDSPTRFPANGIHLFISRFSLLLPVMTSPVAMAQPNVNLVPTAATAPPPAVALPSGIIGPLPAPKTITITLVPDWDQNVGNKMPISFLISVIDGCNFDRNSVRPFVPRRFGWCLDHQIRRQNRHYGALNSIYMQRISSP